MDRKHKILIIEDEEQACDLLFKIISQNSKYLCRAVYTGEAGLALIDSFKPDVILLDVVLPGIDGHSVCSRIREDERHKYIKIIMISGRDTTEERLAGYESGADDYLVKPFCADELLAKIKVFSRLKQTEEVEKIKSSVLSLFSHETKTPLNSVLMGCWHLLDDNALDEPQKDTVKTILRSANRLCAYVDKVCRLCQLKNNDPLELMRVPVSDFIESATNRIESNFNGKINIDYNGVIPEVMVDCRLFSEAFQAVVDNAVKYSPHGGEIDISCRMLENKVEIKVSDKGKGISPEAMESMFDEFSVGNILNHKEGSGLSLAISKIIMQQHNGDLTAETSSDSGAAFRFTLPVKH